MHLTSYLENGKLTIALTGEIDHHLAKSYIEEISCKIEAYNPILCVLDFQDVSFIDSSGVAVVINALRRMTGAGGRLVISGLGSQPKRVMEAAGVHKLITIMEEIK